MSLGLVNMPRAAVPIASIEINGQSYPAIIDMEWMRAFSQLVDRTGGVQPPADYSEIFRRLNELSFRAPVDGDDGEDGAMGSHINYTGTTTVFLRGDGQWATPASSGAESGTAVLDFGTTPGTNIATVAVTGQTTIASDSKVNAWISGIATATHNAYEHLIVPLVVRCGDIVAGDGFTIYASSDLRLDGTFNCYWTWS